MKGWVSIAAVSLALVLASSARAQGIDTTCVLPLTKTDAATVNVAFPDEAATYWISGYQAVPGLGCAHSLEKP